MTDVLAAMDQIAAGREAIFKHVGYAEDWQSSFIEDCRSMFWTVDEYEREWVKYAAMREAVASSVAGDSDKYGPYAAALSMSPLRLLSPLRLSKGIYRGAHLMLAVVNIGGNVLFQAFRIDHEVRAEHPLNQAINSTVAADRAAAMEGLHAKVRLLCSRVTAQDLSSAIREHRANCCQPDCPVLSWMKESLPKETP